MGAQGEREAFEAYARRVYDPAVAETMIIGGPENTMWHDAWHAGIASVANNQADAVTRAPEPSGGLSAEELEAIRKRAEQSADVLRLEWAGQTLALHSGDMSDPVAEWTYAIHTWEPEVHRERAECDTADAELFLHARTDVLALLDALTQDRAERLAAVERENQRLLAEKQRTVMWLKSVKAGIEQNHDPRKRDDLTQHRVGAVLAETYAGVCQILAALAAEPEGRT